MYKSLFAAALVAASAQAFNFQSLFGGEYQGYGGYGGSFGQT